MQTSLRTRFWPSVRSLFTQEKTSLVGLRRLSTSNGGDGDGSGKDPENPPEDADEEDEFALDGFDLEVEEELPVEEVLDAMSEKEVTEELATELVAKMVKSATTPHTSAAPRAHVLPAITRHTISVLRASRISTNAVQAAASDIYPYPIQRKVTAEVSIPDLKLTRPAEVVLRRLAGPRTIGDVVRFSSNKYPTQKENEAHIVSQLDRLVAASKLAVGAPIDNSPLEKWEEVVAEVESQAGEEIIEAGGVSRLLGEEKQLQ